MAKTYKKRIFCGLMCEQIVYQLPDRARPSRDDDPEAAVPRKAYATEEEYTRHKINISRKRHLRNFQANFFPGDAFITLTFDAAHEIHDFEDARRERNNLKRRLQRKWPDAVFFIYMGRGRTTHRIHFHIVAHGLPQDEKQVAEQLKPVWNCGKIKRVSLLRKNCKYMTDDGSMADCGADYHGLANYLFDHWSPEIGGHRWFQTRNALKPEAEKPTEVRIARGYSTAKPPKPPKGYRLIATEGNMYGYQCFWYIKEEEKRPRGRPRKAV